MTQKHFGSGLRVLLKKLWETLFGPIERGKYRWR